MVTDSSILAGPDGENIPLSPVADYIEGRRRARNKLANEIRDFRRQMKQAHREYLEGQGRGDERLDVRSINKLARSLFEGRFYHIPKLTAKQAKVEAENITENVIDMCSRDISHLPCGADDAYIENVEEAKEMVGVIWRVYVRLAAEENGARGYWHL